MPKPRPHGRSDCFCATRADFRRHRETSMLRGGCDLQSQRPPMRPPTGGHRTCDGDTWAMTWWISRSPMRFIRCCTSASAAQHNEPGCFDRTLPGANEKAGELELTGFHLHRVLVRPERFELPTAWFVARYSIQLSYGRIRDGILPESAYARQSFRLSCRRRSLVQNTEKPWKPRCFSEWRRVRDSNPR